MGTSKKKQSSDTHSKGSFGKYEAFIIPSIIFLLIGYFILTKANGDDTIDENVLVGSIVFFMALMFISIPKASGGGTRKRATPKRRTQVTTKSTGTKKTPPKGRASVIEEEEYDDVQKERKIISYPGAASGGKYGDAYIAISQEMILKVRSLLAVSCRNCKDLDACWEKHKDQMEYDTFLESTECHEKIDPAMISSGPPVKVTAEGPGEEVTVEEEYGVEEEPVVSEEDSYETGDGDATGGEDDWGDGGDFDADDDDGDWGDGSEEGEDSGEDEYSDDDDDSSWE